MLNKISCLLSDIKNLTLKIILKYVPKDDAVIFLFGSLAKGSTENNSDIDIGIFSCSVIENQKLALIKNEIQEKAKTLRKIDIIDFSSIQDKEFLKAALGRIRIWYQKGSSKIAFHNLRKHLKD